ncbi:MAG: hypothetical protein LBK29_03930 [Oscillospiraceae bacterium]|jgi:hypothetical protein|nr:hypothetical protein [Oscillospiraceae bacterium]
MDSEKNTKSNNFIAQAYAGYEKLAFGKVNDAIKIMFSEKLDFEELEKMDLFCISEIRRLKDGAMEIKFFDKLKAMEKLENDNFSEKEIPAFYEALKERS